MFPSVFIEKLEIALGQNDSAVVLEALTTAAPVSIRLNRTKLPEHPQTHLEPVPWCEDGFYLPSRPSFSSDPLLHLGYYYVQEASSMAVGDVVKQLLPQTNSGSLVLDLCAAPGGKSTHIASVLGQNDLLVANEVIASRTPILEENLAKWGRANHIVTRADAEFWGRSGMLFDVVVADLPCSGEGLFRKDPEAVKQWSLANVELCAQRQRRIVSEVWKAIKPGGFLVYSTCTFNRSENEDNISQLSALPGFVPVRTSAKSLSFFRETEPFLYRALPGFVVGEGFFIAVIQKQTNETHLNESHKPKPFQAIENKGLWPVHIRAFLWGDDVYATGCSSDLYLNTINKLPGFHSPGVCIGKIIRNVFKPNPRLALINNFQNTNWPTLELNDKEAMAYLRRETLSNSNNSTETTLAKWKGFPIGFLTPNKNRWNNLWPMEWRLRMDVKNPVNLFF